MLRNPLALACALSVVVLASCSSSTKPKQTVETPVFSVNSGVYTAARTVVITTATEQAGIRLTRDGTDPDEGSELYVAAITVDTSVTLKARAYREGWEPSGIAVAVYAITDVAAPVLTPPGGLYTTVQSVSISCSTPGVTVRYTQDGTDPVESSAVYTTPVTVDTTTELRARAWRSGMTASAVVEEDYTIDFPDVAEPEFTPASGTYTVDQAVSIACATAGAEIRYTIDGTDPSASSNLYGASIDIQHTTQIKARGFKEFMDPSSVATADIVIDYPDAAEPAFDPVPGNFTTDQTVSISCSTAGASVYYTTNGFDPTETSTPYSAPFTLSSYTVLKARAYMTAMDSSPVAQGVFNINYPDVAVPVASVSGGVFASSVTVSVTCATAGAVMHYTSNGATPAESDPVWPGSLTITATTTLRVRAFKPAMDPSTVLSQTYAIISGLVAYYPFSGNASDASGNGHNGTLHGSPALGTGHGGDASGAYNLDGVDDYIELAGESGFDLSQFTVSFWIRVPSLPVSEGAYTTNPGEWWIAAKGPIWGNFRIGLYRYGGSSDGVIIYKHTDAGGTFESGSFSSPTYMNAGVWRQITVVVGTDCRIYISGNLALTTAMPNAPPLANNNPVLLGWASDGEANDYFTGLLDEVRFYNRALSAAEVSQIYQYGD